MKAQEKNYMVESQNEFYEDEISLYDIWDIILKYKKQILVIITVGFILSFGGALFARKFRSEYTTQEYRIKYSELENNTFYNMANIKYNKFDSNSVLEKEEYIDRFLELPVLKEIYEKQKPINPKEILFNKREFIKKIISIQGPEKNKNYKTIKIKLDNDLQGAPEIIDVYFEILKEEIPEKINSLLEDKKISVEKNNKEIKSKLEMLEEKIQTIVKKENFNNNGNDATVLLTLENPILVTQIKLYQTLYAETSKELLGIAFFDEKSHFLDNIIDRKENFLFEKGSSKAKIVLLAGIFLSFAFAFSYVFVAEIKEGYKKHKKINK